MSGSGNRKILLVDDEIDIRLPLAQVFESMSFQVLEASSGNEALAICRKEPVDVVLSDIRMPDGDGVFLLKQLRQEFGVRTPILFMSGYADVSPERLYELGAELMIAKPFNLSAIISAVNRTALPVAERWSEGFQQGASGARPLLNLQIAGSGTSGSELAKLGRGGFFIKVDSPKIRSAAEIRFDLSFDQGPVTRLEGWGRRLWSRSNYVGVEILGLSPQTIASYLAWIEAEAPTAFVPAAPGAK